MEAETPTPASLPAKFSRYRSVRKATVNAQQAPPVPQAPPPFQVHKSPSRYRAQRTPQSPPSKPAQLVASPSRPQPQPLPDKAIDASTRKLGAGIPQDAFGTIAQRGANAVVSTAENNAILASPTQLVETGHRRPRDRSGMQSSKGRETEPLIDGNARPQHKNAGQQEAFDILTGEAERQKKLRQKQAEEERAERIAAKERERVRKAEEERDAARKADAERQAALKVEEEKERRRQAKLEREQAKQAEKEKAAATKAPQSPPPSRGISIRRPTKSRKTQGRDRNESSATDSRVQIGRQAAESPPVRNARPSASRGEATRPGIPPLPSTGFDAPKSAVNAGKRTVTLQYLKQTFPLLVTPESTPKELLAAAEEHLGAKLMAGSMMLVESFEQLGLERPLRWYEHVRNVLNSWDTDLQNKLLLEASSAALDGQDLGVRHAPQEQPGDTSVSVYHSQKPGHWGKRWVTLRSDGQVLVAKENGAEARNICHMSDFDVYFPTARQAKRLRSPKKHCFAVKSQQKSAMFLSTENFVHFFATKDREVADAWYRALQGWRSWYLVHEMGLGRAGAASHALNESLPKTGLLAELGTFKPLMPELNSHKPLLPLVGSLGDDAPLHRSPNSPSQPTRLPPPQNLNEHSDPPSSGPKKLVHDASKANPASLQRSRTKKSSIVQGPPPSSMDQPFTEGGLLGRSYSLRQKGLQNVSSNPLLHDAGELRSNGVKPLVDLTPEYREAPQHARKGHGVQLERLPAGGLVGAATTPEHAFSIPPTTTWRRSNDIQRGPTVREARSYSDQQKPAEAFINSGLLAQTGDGQGGRMRGRGVRNGMRDAKEPMLDLTEASKYAPGSLLADVERHGGGDEGPVIDRGKKVEVNAKTGESA